jgi:hypothetical protein
MWKKHLWYGILINMYIYFISHKINIKKYNTEENCEIFFDSVLPPPLEVYLTSLLLYSALETFSKFWETSANKLFLIFTFRASKSSLPQHFLTFLLFFCNNYLPYLKGQSHEKVGELWVWGNGLALTKNSYWFFKIFDRPFNSCDFFKVNPVLIWTYLAPRRIPNPARSTMYMESSSPNTWHPVRQPYWHPERSHPAETGV